MLASSLVVLYSGAVKQHSSLGFFQAVTTKKASNSALVRASNARTHIHWDLTCLLVACISTKIACTANQTHHHVLTLQQTCA